MQPELQLKEEISRMRRDGHSAVTVIEQLRDRLRAAGEKRQTWAGAEEDAENADALSASGGSGWRDKSGNASKKRRIAEQETGNSFASPFAAGRYENGTGSGSPILPGRFRAATLAGWRVSVALASRSSLRRSQRASARARSTRRRLQRSRSSSCVRRQRAVEPWKEKIACMGLQVGRSLRRRGERLSCWRRFPDLVPTHMHRYLYIVSLALRGIIERRRPRRLALASVCRFY